MTVRAFWNGALIAESDDTVVIEGNHYFPSADVNEAFLEASDSHTFCSWKGTASYYNLRVGEERNVDAVWYYPDPYPAAEAVLGRIAFWHGVEVVESELEASSQRRTGS